MDFKQIFYKVIKGGVTGAASAFGAIQIMSFFGIHTDTKLAILTAIASVGNGFLHGAANAIEQYVAAK